MPVVAYAHGHIPVPPATLVLFAFLWWTLNGVASASQYVQMAGPGGESVTWRPPCRVGVQPQHHHRLTKPHLYSYELWVPGDSYYVPVRALRGWLLSGDARER